MKRIVKHMRPKLGMALAHLEVRLEQGEPQYDNFLVNEIDETGNPTGKRIPGCVCGVDVKIPEGTDLTRAQQLIDAAYENIKRQHSFIGKAEGAGMIGVEQQEDIDWAQLM